MRTFLKSLALVTAVSMAWIIGIPVRGEGTLTITAFGDSLTQGYGLADGDGLVPQLQAWLDASGADVRLVNAGVSGDTTAGGAARIAWTLSDPTDGLIVALGGNDFLRGLSPEDSKANLEKILVAAETAGVPVLLVGFRAPLNYGPEYKAAFDGAYPDLAEIYDILFYPFYFEGLGVGENTVEMIDFLQADATHPNAEGVRMIVEALGPSVLSLLSVAAGS